MGPPPPHLELLHLEPSSPRLEPPHLGPPLLRPPPPHLEPPHLGPPPPHLEPPYKTVGDADPVRGCAVSHLFDDAWSWSAMWITSLMPHVDRKNKIMIIIIINSVTHFSA